MSHKERVIFLLISYKVLVVDDSITVHKLMKKYLESAGHIICATAKNGQQAVDLYSQHHPDVVFMDITMPVMDGIGALGEIKRKDPKARIIMLSAMGDEEILDEAKKLGATMFLQKPFDANKLIKALDNLPGGN